MDKKVVMGVVLGIALIVGWNTWYYKRYGATIEQNRAARAQSAKTFSKNYDGKGEKKPSAQPQSGDPELFLPSGTGIGEAEPETGISDNIITVDTGVTKVLLSSRGGVLTSLQLLKYLDKDGKPIELVSRFAMFKPLTVEFATPESTQKVNSSVFSVKAPSDYITLAPHNPSAEIIFEYSLESGFRLKKKLVFHNDSYRFDLEVNISHPGMDVAGSTFGLMWPGLGGDIESSYSYEGPVVLIRDKRLTEKPDDGEKMVYEGNVAWTGLTKKYYCMAFLPESESSKVINRKVGKKDYSTTLQLVARKKGPANRLSVYAGPKSHEELGKIDNEFIRMINYGWLDFISQPLYKLMDWFYKFTGNYGWSIIILTIIIKIIFYPLSHKSFKSMNKMKQMQPHMKMIQQRYKNDKSKMNEELVALYKKHKINPLGGCLPMVMQIPVFIALYRVLLDSIELKGAHFIFWITDLSLKDPYYVSPLLMGLSMFLQQKLSPAGTDPMQKNLMLAMPVIFTIMFLNFPSGLVIYWLVNNVLSIAQQFHISKSKSEEAPA
ncbi:MAG: membrane protein insertase YidC [bacterium]|nr:MAG: membrane protein insertase YidC [bacterium]